MSECTTPAQCTEREYEAARAAGLLVVSVADEIAIHKFAEAMRAELLAELRRIATADPSQWEPDVRDQFQQWAQSRARAAIAKATGSAS